MVIYKSASDRARDVSDFLRDFERQTARKLETIDPDSRQGADICRLYDIVEYPTIVATSEEGQLLNMWRGVPLPTIDDVNAYV
jgi:hypothetical protein